MEAIGHVRHKNLVRLLGYCVEGVHRQAFSIHFVYGKLPFVFTCNFVDGFFVYFSFFNFFTNSDHMDYFRSDLFILV